MRMHSLASSASSSSLPACLPGALPLLAQGVEARHRLQPETDLVPTLANGIEREAGIVERPGLLQLCQVVLGEIGRLDHD